MTENTETFWGFELTYSTFEKLERQLFIFLFFKEKICFKKSSMFGKLMKTYYNQKLIILS